MNTAYIGLGSNIEPRLDYLEKGLQLLNSESEIAIVAKSSVYETVPVGYTDQADFLNMAAKVHTSLSPARLLKVCQSIEQQLKRKREIRFGPRTIDLDILLYNNENIKTETLVIPHPRMHERAFVLVPLAELNRDLHLPSRNITVGNLLDSITPKEKKEVKKWIPNVSDEE